MTALEVFRAALQDARTEAATLRIANTRQAAALRELQRSYESDHMCMVAPQSGCCSLVNRSRGTEPCSRVRWVRDAVAKAFHSESSPAPASDNGAIRQPETGTETGKNEPVSPLTENRQKPEQYDDLPLGHAFKAAPFYPDRCDVQFDEHGRLRTCARPQREHQRSEP